MECVRGGAGGARSQTQEIGLAEENSTAVMLRDGPCFLHDMFPPRCNTFEEWKNWESGRKKLRARGKDVRGIEKGTKTVK